MLSYGKYVGILFGVNLGLFIIYMVIFTFLIPTRIYANFIKGFFYMKAKVTDNDDDESQTSIENSSGDRKDIIESAGFRVYLASIISILLSQITTIFIVGCVVTVEYYYSGDSCPDRPKDCFIMSKSFIAFSPIDQFVCSPGEIVKTLNSTSFHAVRCYGYILNKQTILNILKQLGICAGILVISSTLLAFLYRLYDFIFGRIIIIILLLGYSVTMFLFDASKIRLSFLQYYLMYMVMMICFITVWSKLIIKCFR